MGIHHGLTVILLSLLLTARGMGSAEETKARAGKGNLVLAEKDGKLAGSFTYQLIVGHFYEWNTDPTAVPGILDQLAKRTGVKAKVDFKAIALDDPQLLKNPVLLMTGNRAFFLSKEELQNLRRYLTSGGFLYVDDCGGADWSLRRMLEKAVPDTKLEELKPAHPIFKQPYGLEQVPKVVDLYHGKAKAFGLKVNGRLAVVYTYDTDVPCAWERYPDGSYVHAIDPKKREAAMRFGVNVLEHALRQHLGKVKAAAATVAVEDLPKAQALPAQMVRNYPMKRQLPCSYIMAMAADEKSAWFGGFSFLPGEDEGLARFDKTTHKWRVFMDAEGVLSEEINCLALDGDRVLVGADTWKWTKGLAIFRPGTGKWSTMNTEHGLPHNRVVAIAKDGEDLWLGCRLGLGVIRGGSGRAEVIRDRVFPKGGPFMIGVMADESYVWANHFAGVARLDKRTGEWAEVARLTSLIPRHAMDLTHGGGAAWFLAPTEDDVRLIRFDYRTRQFAEWPPARNVDLLHAMSLAADDKELLVGMNEQGILAFPMRGGPPKRYGMPDPLPKGIVREILIDGEVVWASVLPHNGLWRLNRARDTWEQIPYRTGTPASHILSLCQVAGRLFVGTVSGGPWAYEPEEEKWQSLNHELVREGNPYVYLGDRNAIKWDNVYSMLPDAGKVWMGTNHGLVVHDPARTPRGFEIIGPLKFVSRGLALADGLVWAANASGEVLAYDPGKGEWQEERKWSLKAPVRAFCGWKGSFYLGSEKGLFTRAVGAAEAARVDAGIGDVYGLWPTAAGLWIASEKGVHLLKTAGQTPGPVRSAPGWGRVNCVYQLGRTVYVGTTSGLIACDMAGKPRAFYDASSGLGGSAIGAITSNSEYLWLGTLGAGLSGVKLEALRLTE